MLPTTLSRVYGYDFIMIFLNLYIHLHGFFAHVLVDEIMLTPSL